MSWLAFFAFSSLEASSETQGQLVGTKTFARENPVAPTSCPWVSEDGLEVIGSCFFKFIALFSRAFFTVLTKKPL